MHIKMAKIIEIIADTSQRKEEVLSEPKISQTADAVRITNCQIQHFTIAVMKIANTAIIAIVPTPDLSTETLPKTV